MSTNKPAPIADYGTLAAFNVAFDMVRRANGNMDRAGIPPAPVCAASRLLAASPATPTIADDVHQLRELAPMVDEEHRRRRELRTAATDDLYAACRAVLREGHPLGAALNKVIAALEKADGVS